MKVTYIEHSGFMAETESVCLLFDYYRGEIPQIETEKDLVVFVSHRHEDHYNRDIFELIRQYPSVKFVLSTDIRTKRLTEEYMEKGIDLSSHILSVKPNTIQKTELSNGETLEIETLKSTDEGVAFFLTIGEKKIYHAGDLNLWVWEGESLQYNNNMKALYRKELEKLKGREIDAAFIPLDPRQGNEAFYGLQFFAEATDSRHIFPMHFWGKYSIISDFLKKFPEYRDRIVLIEKKGQKFTIV